MIGKLKNSKIINKENKENENNQNNANLKIKTDNKKTTYSQYQSCK